VECGEIQRARRARRRSLGDLQVAVVEVKGGEDRASFQVGHAVREFGDWILVVLDHRVSGSMLTTAPESARNWTPEVESLTKTRRPGGMALMLWQPSFPARHKAFCSWRLRCRR